MNVFLVIFNFSYLYLYCCFYLSITIWFDSNTFVTINLSIYLSICLSIYLSQVIIYLSVYYIHIYLIVNLQAYFSQFILSISPSIYLMCGYLSIYVCSLFIYLSITIHFDPTMIIKKILFLLLFIDHILFLFYCQFFPSLCFSTNKTNMSRFLLIDLPLS
ncbi:unnamed protein product [Acanthosepion pharaonis]|uniref:Uncharacterized protein n=1 Tax=Acanthosepion pharaonis TaxID=158019 RepID=A0A812EF75_ACAPH|nr:unnamed protein product [Sepia pharaonis]